MEQFYSMNAMANPYKEISGRKLYKGDIHFHTGLSDGASSPDEMLDRLIECGFDFCGIADHDMPCAQGTHNGLVILTSQEMSSDNGHVVALNTCVVRKNSWTIAEQIRNIRATGGMAILSHPKIREFIPDQSPTYNADRLVNELNMDFDGMEIFTRNVGSGFKTAVDRLDLVWTALHFQNRFAPVWGFASSDGHHVDHISENTGIMVWSVSRKPEDLLKAIYTGAFFSIADSRARFSHIAFNGKTLKASAFNCKLIKLIKMGGEIAACEYYKNEKKCDISYETSGEESYLRIEAYDINGQAAYSNPIKIPDKK